METRRKTHFRLSELEDFQRQIRETLTREERERRQRLREQSDRFLHEMAAVPGDVKDWIRQGRGDSWRGD